MIPFSFLKAAADVGPPPPPPDPYAGESLTLVDLSTYFNLEGFTEDNTPNAGPGLDGVNTAPFIGQVMFVSSVSFNLAPLFQNNVIQCSGQTVAVPPGNYDNILLLTTATEGAQTSQQVTVNYTGLQVGKLIDVSDWVVLSSFSDQTIAWTYNHRNSMSGTPDNSTAYLFMTAIGIDVGLNLESITLPTNSDLFVFAITLTTPPP